MRAGAGRLKVTQSRKINGKNYYNKTARPFKLKSRAKKAAKLHKKMGYNTRIIKYRDGYRVFARKK